jgi:predicted ester cyclase
MSTSLNRKEVYREYIREIWELSRLDALEHYFTGDFVDHAAPPGRPPGRAGTRQFFSMLRAAFPDYRMAIELEVAEGKLLVVRLLESGTHHGMLFGIPPTGRRISMSSTRILRFRGRRMCEQWSNRDDLGLMQQLGVIRLTGS